MKRIILSCILASFAGKHPLNNGQTSMVLVDVRAGDWPISLEKAEGKKIAAYFLQFRDQQVLTGVVMDTLPFSDIGQLKYLEKALTALKSGTNGDIAKFKDYSIKRTDSRTDGRSYLLRLRWGLTNFRQPEADTLVSAIRKL